MQYLLTEEEYKNLLKKREHEIGISKAKLQKLCTKIADTHILTEGWYKGKAWKCILTVEKESEESGYDNEWYCDDCPMQEICPYENKNWSK